MFSMRIFCLLISLGFMLLGNNNGLSAEIPNLTLELEALDKKHQQFSQQFHLKNIIEPSNNLKSFQNIDLLEQAASQLYLTNKQLATSLIVKNLPTLKNNYHSLAIIKLIKTLLDQNEWNSANDLFQLIKEDGEQALFSNISYLFADFYFQRKNWLQTLKLLDENINDLSNETYFHALLIQGISLQKLAKHREAISVYEKISISSKYYNAARVNMAIANIRQGWWTDGHNLIQEILVKSEQNHQESTLNRLYLTLGFSFLKQEYYRNSRDSFRNVGINSLYTNQALLGIALTAANQKDYIGALNATRILKNKVEKDLSVDESHFLMPYFYERLQQHTTASTGYSQAVGYYQGRIAQIYNLLNSNIELTQYPIQIKSDAFIMLNNHLINFSETYPNYFFKNYLKFKNYGKYLNQINNNKLTNDFITLKDDYEKTIIKMIRNLLTKKIEQLNSYMDQSRYGLARLYDNNLVDK